MQDVIIRKALHEDMPKVLHLIHELAVYEKSPESVSLSLEELTEAGMGEHPMYHCRVAEYQNQVVGFCLFYMGFSTWKGKMVYLDDLFVLESYRKMGIGHLLFEAVRNFAQVQNANLMRWMVLEWNEPALSFYRKKKAAMDTEWIQCQLEKSQL